MKLHTWRAGLVLSTVLLGLLLMAPVGRAQTSRQWNLQITNLAGSTVNYTYDQLLAMPVTTVNAELDCEGDLVAAGNWSGVSLSHLLQQAGLDPAVAYVSFKAQDGYAVTISSSEALNQYVIIAYELNGSTLPEALRLVLPGISGDLWIALITSITMSTAWPNADQSGSTSTNSTGQTSTQVSTTPASATQVSSPDGSSFPVVVGYGVALGATVALMAAGYLTWLGRKAE